MSETVIEPHSKRQNAARPVRVCILGSVNAGKTTFLVERFVNSYEVIVAYVGIAF
jgi:polynucleotide 5'-kinase involved in rRNA processing